MNIEHDYLKLLKDVLENGKVKGDRTGTGTISVFGRQIRHDMSKGFPLLTTKKMYWKGIVTELLWFLRGDTNIKFLVDNNCHIWDGDAYKEYLKKYKKDKLHGVIYEDDETQNRPFSKEEFINWIKNNDKFSKLYGELGPIYGKQWRSWKIIYDNNVSEWVGEGEDAIPIYKALHKLDQIKQAINKLKTDPDSRRNIVSAWNVAELDQMTLPPCHNFFQFYTRELSREERWELYVTRFPQMKDNKFMKMKNGQWVDSTENEDMKEYDTFSIPKRAISLMWNQRSVDTFLGLPFNIASYGLLLEIIAKEVNMVPDELIGTLGDVHLYKNHIEQAKEQLTREPKRLSKVLINNGEVDNNGIPFTKSALDGYDITDFELVDYQSHSSIKAELSN